MNGGNPDRSAGVSIHLIKAGFTSEHYPELLAGKETHDSALRLIAQLVRYTDDRDLVRRIVLSGLPADYAGNTIREIDGMIEGAVARGLSRAPFERYFDAYVPKGDAVGCIVRVEVEGAEALKGKDGEFDGLPGLIREILDVWAYWLADPEFSPADEYAFVAIMMT